MKQKIYNMLILDKSGSMNSIREATVGGVNETIGGVKSVAKKNAEEQEHFFSLFQFCGCEKTFVKHNIPADEAELITMNDFVPCCNTPLYDAIGIACNKLEHEIENEGNALVQVTIITDGYENSSTEYRANDVKSLIERLRRKGWTFAYMGANHDVKEVGELLSIRNTMSFNADVEGTRHAFAVQRAANENWSDRVKAVKFCNCSISEKIALDEDFFEDKDEKKK